MISQEFIIFKKDLSKTRPILCLDLGGKNKHFFYSDCVLVSTVRRAEFTSLALFVVPQGDFNQRFMCKYLPWAAKEREGRSGIHATVALSNRREPSAMPQVLAVATQEGVH